MNAFQLISEFFQEILEHNSRTGEQIFVNLSPHVNQMEVHYWDNPTKNADTEEDDDIVSYRLNYDCTIENLQKRIKALKILIF